MIKNVTIKLKMVYPGQKPTPSFPSQGHQPNFVPWSHHASHLMNMPPGGYPGVPMHQYSHFPMNLYVQQQNNYYNGSYHLPPPPQRPTYPPTSELASNWLANRNPPPVPVRPKKGPDVINLDSESPPQVIVI